MWIAPPGTDMRGCILLALSFAISLAHAYSPLTHEAIIDSAWEISIKPLLLKRFPQAKADDALLEAHAYAYGGCIIQDMGYYPFGNKLFSDLVHYVRSGDFVAALLRDATDINEYAFALGALAHYASDTEGHPIAVNRAVPMEYPKLRRKFGRTVTYEDDKSAHLKVEYGFDVLQVARGNYAPQSYHNFVGFKVAKPVLERAFQDTYGLKLGDVLMSVDLAIGTFRHTVATIIPESTKVAWSLKKDDIVKARPSMTRKKFLYNLSRASYEKDWDQEYEKPGILARILAFLFRLIPKVGPFRSIAFKAPTAVTARLFEESFNKTLVVYKKFVAGVGSQNARLENLNLDTGNATRPGKYRMADDTYAALVDKLAEHHFDDVTPRLRTNIANFYGDFSAPLATKSDPVEWKRLETELAELKAQSVSGAAREATESEAAAR